jgi:pimeloyl-ACP methyl ester carboxylesterase
LPRAVKATFVLVHGAWHGGWCWQRVTPLLRAAGCEVHTPSLTGLGDRAHLADRKIDLEMHIADICAVFEMEDLADVVLVGHSYAGMVIAGVADRAAARLKRLVYLDAFAPAHGECVLDYWPAEGRADIEKRAAAAGGFVPPTPLPAFGVTEPADLAWAEPRIRPQPLATWTQPLLLKHGETNLPRAYIRCTNPARPVFDQFTRRLAADPTWTYRELDAGHDCMIADPHGTAELLLSLA